ncbi:MAG: hypothetical protein R3C45_22080, partial [Phycisphaerales bacterium]
MDGGVVTSYTGYLGKEADAEGTAIITGAGSRWETNSGLYVGGAGVGTLNILDGAVVNTSSYTNYAASIGDKSGAVGVVTIDGAGSEWNIDGPFYVAEEGTGTININNNGVVNVTGATYIELESSANGTINFNNGTLNTLNLFASPAKMLGVGTINTQGIVSDIDIRFDQASGLAPQVNISPLTSQNVTLNVDTSDTSVNNILGAGFRGFGSLTIAEGVSVSSAQGLLGYHAGSQGTATVTGTGSQWITRDELIVGHKGLGRLNIHDGGYVKPDEIYIGDEANAYGIVDVKDSGSFLRVNNIYVGRYGTGSLTIRDGALGGSPGYSYSMYLGSELGSHGAAEISGAGSSWQSGSILVGGKGHGMLDVRESGNVTLSGSLNIGAYDGGYGEANISGAGSTVTLGSYLYVGSGGTGVLNIENSGVLESRQGRIGAASDAIGIVTVTDPGSRWDAIGDSYIGGEGSGTMNILNGANVNHLSDGYKTDIGNEAGSIGRVNVSGTGSQWDIQGYLTVGNLGDGRLYIEDNAAVHVAYDTWVRKDAAATGSIHFNNGTLNTAGLIASASELIGAGTINTGTIVSDVDLVFDQASGLHQQLSLNAVPSQNITLNVDPGADPASNRTMGLGYRGTGSMTLADGLSMATVEGILGYYNGSNGSATITGAGTQWINTGNMTVGKGGSGLLTILNGGVLQNNEGYIGYEAGSTGVVNVSGNGSQWNNVSKLWVGYNSPGSLTITDGGQVNSDVSIVGYESGGTGWVTLTGNGTQWNTANLIVGSGAVGILTVEAGAVLSTDNGNIGATNSANGTVIVTGADSVWNNNDGLYVGRNGEGALRIENGGRVYTQHFFNPRTYIGHGVGSTGTVTVSGESTLWDIQTPLYVGYQGTGTLNIEDSAIVRVTDNAWIASEGSSVGTINLNGGTFDLRGNSIFSGQGAGHHFNFTAGILKNATNIDLKQPFVQSGGILSPGGPIGQTDIVGDYTLTVGTVEIEVGGAGNPIDLVTATGDIDISILGTTLDLRALGSMAAGTYTVLESTGGNITGMFENISAFNLFGVNVTVLNTGTAITVTLDSDLVFADPNLDGFVGIEDLNIVLGNWNQYVTMWDLQSGDLNGDGYVGAADLNAILGNWNAGTPPLPPDVSATIPEPGT